MAIASFQAESNQVPQRGAKVHGAVIQKQSQIGGHLVDLLDHLLGHSYSDLFHISPLGLERPHLWYIVPHAQPPVNRFP